MRLILIGLLHAHLIWAGDIVYGYGYGGLLLFPRRRLSAKALIITGTVLILLHSLQGIGVPLNYWAAQQWIAAGFTAPTYFTYLASTADAGRFSVAMGYTGLLMMACKSGVKFLTAPLAAVGRTALSNYLLTSILCTLFFNGYGLGNFGKLARHELYYVVLGMWAINLTISPIWLRYFRFGPAEWAWQPLRRDAAIIESSS